MKKTELDNTSNEFQIDKIIKERLFIPDHPKTIYNKIGEIIGKGIDLKEISDEEKKVLKTGVYLKSFNESHILLWESFGETHFSTLAIDFTNSLIKDYQCITSLEKSLCETIALNYVGLMKSYSNFQNIYNQKIIDYKVLDILGKQIDRANRMYLISLNNLIEIKRPRMNINIKTKNAYLGNNQQINNKNELGKND